MVHVDVKKLGRIPAGGGWRLHGRDDPRSVAHEHERVKIGYDFVHTAIDDHTRLAYSRSTRAEADCLGVPESLFVVPPGWRAGKGPGSLLLLWHRESLDGLAGYVRDEFEVLVHMQHDQSGEFCGRGDDEVGDRWCAVLASASKGELHLDGAVLDGGRQVFDRHG